MSEVQLLFEQLSHASGQERRTKLQALEQQLAASSPSIETLQRGLSHPSNDVRRLLLDAIGRSPATSLTLSSCFDIILQSLRQSLQAPSQSLSAIRTASAGLKALSRLLSVEDGKDSASSLAPHEVQILVDAILTAMAWGLAPLQTRSSIASHQSRQWRSTPGSAFAFEKREPRLTSRRQPKATNALRQQGSSSSLRSEASIASTRMAPSEYDTDVSVASDAEEEDMERRQRNLKEAKRAVRYRSIGSINVINTKSCRLLLIHWSRLFLDAEGSGRASLMDVVERDDSLANRIAAVHVVQALLTSGARAGFMAGAEERSRMSAFTSLSSRMASIIVDLRKRLLAIMQDPNAPPSLIEAILKAMNSLVTSTSPVKLRASHAQVLRESTLQLCSNTSAAVAVPAYALLSALVASDRGADQGGASSSIITTLQDETASMEVRLEAWNTLTALIKQGAVRAEAQEGIPPILSSSLSPTNSLELRQAAAACAQACVASNSKISITKDILQLLLRDPSPTVRAIAADCLPDNVDYSDLGALLHDPDSTVRASTIRAIGVKIQALGKRMWTEEIFAALQDTSLLVRMRASWSLGNLCEGPDLCSLDTTPGTIIVGESCDCPGGHLEVIKLLQQCLALQNDDERVMVNAVRGAGAILEHCPTLTADDHRNLFGSVTLWLLDALQRGAPKVRWNAAASLDRCLKGEGGSNAWLVTLNDSIIPRTLAKVICDDSNFKVRLAAAQAMTTLHNGGLYPFQLGEPEEEKVKQHLREAIAKVDEQVKQASFQEAQLHAYPLQKELQALSKALFLN